MQKILMKGNDAVAEAAVQAGCTMYFGYPITPQTEISEYLSRRLPEAGGVFLQAESEIGAIYMVYGAAASGKRVMTSSSGPGFSLKQEGISYLCSAELPCVLVNISRGGPGLGNIQPSQADYFQAVKGGGHGDYRVLVLAPSSVQELADLTFLAFYLADKYRNPVEILGDGMLGQMMEPVSFRNPGYPAVSKGEWAITGKGNRERRIILCFALDPRELEKLNLHLAEKYSEMERSEILYESFGSGEPELLLVGYGTVGRILKSVVREAQKRGIELTLVRPVTLFPFPAQVIRKKAQEAGGVMVVEMNLGQMVEDVKLAVEGRVPVHFTDEAVEWFLPWKNSWATWKQSWRGGRSTVKTVFERPKTLLEKPFTYCPGCHHGLAHRLIAEVIDELDIAGQTIGVGPVGCSVYIYDFLDIDFIMGAHGRAPATAIGVKRALPDRVVFSYQGDGDIAAIGTAEIVHAAARGECISAFFINNAIFGMTGGQMAPTTLRAARSQQLPRWDVQPQTTVTP